MTDADIDRLQQALGIVLPPGYRRAVCPYPIPAAAGNADLAVWDDPDRLIAFNLEMRAGAPGGVPPWPPRFFAIGHPGDGCPYALDLEDGAPSDGAPSDGGAVFWVDHGSFENPATQREAASFDAWAARYFAVLREEMAGEGVDPAGTPQARAAAEARGARASALGCLLLLAGVAGLLAVGTLVARC